MISWVAFEEVVVNGISKHANFKVVYNELAQVPRDADFDTLESVARASLNAVYESLGLEQEILSELAARPVVLPTVVNREAKELYYVFEPDVTLSPYKSQLDKLQRILEVANIPADVFVSEVIASIFGSTSLERICPKVYICSVDLAQAIFSIYFSHTYRSTVEELRNISLVTCNTYEHQAELLGYICSDQDLRYVVQSKIAITGIDYVQGSLEPKLKYYFPAARLTRDELERLEEVSGIKIADSAARFGLDPGSIHLVGVDFSADRIAKVKHYFRAL